MARQFTSFRLSFHDAFNITERIAGSMKTRQAAALLAAWRSEQSVAWRACRARINYSRCNGSRHRSIQFNWSINPGGTPGPAPARRGRGTTPRPHSSERRKSRAWRTSVMTRPSLIA